MVHVDYSESPNRKYVNPNEIQEGLDLLNALNLDSEISGTLIITPVRSCLSAARFLKDIQRSFLTVRSLSIV